MDKGLAAAIAILTLAGLKNRKTIEPEPEPEPIKRIIKQGRNEQCGCNSGKKFKKCCLNGRPG